MNITKTYLLAKLQKRQSLLSNSSSGFTLLELLMVVIMIGVLAVIGGAGFLGWMSRMRVNAARNDVASVVRNAQSRAKQQSGSWQASFRNSSGRVQWAIHPANSEPSIWTTVDENNVIIDDNNTDFENSGTPENSWKIVFDYKGNLDENVTGTEEKITLSNSGGGYKRCIIVKTLLGSLYNGNDQECE